MIPCPSCQILRINGVWCHETGCPDAYLDEVRECRECGGDFVPDSREDRFCGDECRAAYYGHPLCDEVVLDDDDGLYDSAIANLDGVIHAEAIRDMADDGQYGRIE